MNRSGTDVLSDFPDRPPLLRAADRIAAMLLLPSIAALGIMSAVVILGLPG